MTPKRVVLSVSARADLDEIFAWFADRAGNSKAHAITREIREFAASLSTLAERGAPRPELAPGVRILVLAGRATLVYRSSPDMILILRIAPAGRDLPRALG